jgi:hypothetical protein
MVWMWMTPCPPLAVRWTVRISSCHSESINGTMAIGFQLCGNCETEAIITLGPWILDPATRSERGYIIGLNLIWRIEV